MSVRLLAVDGKSTVAKALEDWRRSSPEEYRGIIGGLNILRNLERMEASRIKRVSPDALGRGVYELCNRGGGNARVFFFYAKRTNSVIVVTNAFWKGGKKQGAAFDEAAALKRAYERQLDSE